MNAKFKKAIVTGAVFFGVFFGVFIVINSIDEELNSEFKALVERLDKPVKQKDNAYFYMVGLQSTSDENDTYEAGKKIQARYEMQLADDAIRLESHNFYKPHYDNMGVKSGEIEFCEPTSTVKCISRYQSNKDLFSPIPGEPNKLAFDGMLAANQLLINRYEKLVAYEYYQEPAESFPAKRRIKRIHKLYLAHLAREWIKGNKQDVFKQLSKVHTFWRNVSAGKGNLHTEELTTDIIVMNLNFLLEMIENCGSCKEFQKPVIKMLAPVKQDEITLSEAILRDSVSIYKQINAARKNNRSATPDNLEGWLMSKLLLINAAHNTGYKLFSAGARHYDQTPQKLYDSRKQWEEFLEDYSNPSYLDYYFNFSSSMLREFAAPMFKEVYRRSSALVDYHEMVQVRFKEKLNH